MEKGVKRKIRENRASSQGWKSGVQRWQLLLKMRRIIFLELTSGFCEWSSFPLLTFIARTMKGYSELQGNESTKKQEELSTF